MWWNFVGRSHDEVVAAQGEWNAGGRRRVCRGLRAAQRLGTGGSPAPDLPGVRLRPRAGGWGGPLPEEDAQRRRLGSPLRLGAVGRLLLAWAGEECVGQVVGQGPARLPTAPCTAPSDPESADHTRVVRG